MDNKKTILVKSLPHYSIEGSVNSFIFNELIFDKIVSRLQIFTHFFASKVKFSLNYLSNLKLYAYFFMGLLKCSFFYKTLKFKRHE